MVDQNPKRSIEPVFWFSFGAGGTFSAIFAPVMILVVCFILPFGSPIEILKILYLGLGNILGNLFMFLLIVLPIWSSLHRLHHLAHDLKIHVPANRFVFYGIAGVLTVITFYAIFLYK